MLPEKFTIQDDFPPTTYEQWREIAEEGLRGASFDRKLVTHTYEGIDVQPVYTSSDQPGGPDGMGLPGFPPFVRGPDPLGAVLTGWDLRQEHGDADLAVCNQAILEDLEGGVTSILLRLDQAARDGLDPSDDAAAEQVGVDGVAAYDVEDLDTVLDGVELQMIGIALDAGAAFVPAAAALVALWERRGVPLDAARGAFNADPLATLASAGHLPVDLDVSLQQLADLTQWTAGRLPNVTAAAVDTAPYHHAGATAAQDVAFAMATAVEYLRVVTAGGMSVDDAARQILFRFSVGTHHFLSIAKLRAARAVWARVVEVCGGDVSQAGAMRMHVRTSNRVLTQRDPYVNLLRNTVGSFSAGIGGADAITSVPFDYVAGRPDAFSRRVARNSVLILQEEAHLHRVVDPGGGSWFLDSLTQQVAEKAWEIFQEVERQGGMRVALTSGWVAAQIDSAFAPRARDIARRKEGITGVSEFPNVSEERSAPDPVDLTAIRQAAVDRRTSREPQHAKQPTSTDAGDQPLTFAAAQAAAMLGASLGQLAAGLGFGRGTGETMGAIEPRSFAEPFEELRDASDAWLESHGKRPTVFLANMGPVAHHTARATYAKNFFEAGGFEVISNDGFAAADAAKQAFTDSGASFAVICSSDKLYTDFVPELVPQLKSAGARGVILAGRPGDNEEAWRTAGVDRFIFIGCDVLVTLQELLREEGVLSS